jgi:hypothetical protein
MSWIHKIDDGDQQAVGDGKSYDERIDRSPKPASWDPLEVWLTRVKQPRDRAALRAAASPSFGAGKRQD